MEGTPRQPPRLPSRLEIAMPGRLPRTPPPPPGAAARQGTTRTTVVVACAANAASGGTLEETESESERSKRPPREKGAACQARTLAEAAVAPGLIWRRRAALPSAPGVKRGEGAAERWGVSSVERRGRARSSQHGASSPSGTGRDGRMRMRRMRMGRMLGWRGGNNSARKSAGRGGRWGDAFGAQLWRSAARWPTGDSWRRIVPRPANPRRSAIPADTRPYGGGNGEAKGKP